MFYSLDPRVVLLFLNEENRSTTPQSCLRHELSPTSKLPSNNDRFELYIQSFVAVLDNVPPIPLLRSGVGPMVPRSTIEKTKKLCVDLYIDFMVRSAITKLKTLYSDVCIWASNTGPQFKGNL